MTRHGVQFRLASHLRWRKVNLVRDKARGGETFCENQLVPIRKEDCRNVDGVIDDECRDAAACLPDLAKGLNEYLTVGPWKERHTGWTVRYTRAVYLIEEGVTYTGTERRDNPPVEI